MRPAPSFASSLVLAALALSALVVLVAGCGGSDSTARGAAGGSGDKLNVVAAEDFWGSIAEQLGGDKVEVTDIITNPAADPHDYEPTSDDAKTFAGAEMAIVNGIGYDEWASKLLAAGPNDERTELNVGDVVGLAGGDNPHQWYSPESVHKVVAQIVADYEAALPDDASYFAARKKAFGTEGLGEYDKLIAAIRKEYSGTPVGASESILEPLAPALGLKLITPGGFMDGISEGTEPTPQERATADEQVRDKQLKLWVYNSQNTTPDVNRVTEEAEQEGIPVATVTETMTPEGASFQEWMVGELKGLRKALGEGA